VDLAILILTFYLTGECTTSVAPIYEGFQLSKGVEKQCIGGRNITEYLLELLKKEEGNGDIGREHIETVKEIKEKDCYCAYDPSDEQVKVKERILVNGKKIKIGKSQFQAFEALFEPSLLGDSFKKEKGKKKKPLLLFCSNSLVGRDSSIDL